jgi:hypothetical protein
MWIRPSLFCVWSCGYAQSAVLAVSSPSSWLPLSDVLVTVLVTPSKGRVCPGATACFVCRFALSWRLVCSIALPVKSAFWLFLCKFKVCDSLTALAPSACPWDCVVVLLDCCHSKDLLLCCWTAVKTF